MTPIIDPTASVSASDTELANQIIAASPSISNGALALLIAAYVSPLRKSNEELNRRNTELHRRCQKAEALLPKWTEINTTKFSKGSAARGMLVYAVAKAQEEFAELRKKYMSVADDGARLDWLLAVLRDFGVNGILRLLRWEPFGPTRADIDSAMKTQKRPAA